MSLSESASRGAQLLSVLQHLQSTNPTKLAQTATTIADQLTVTAQSATGTDQAVLLRLAERFREVAAGDLSGFQPPQPSQARTPAQAYRETAQWADPAHQALYQPERPSNFVQEVLSSISHQLTWAVGSSSTSTALSLWR